MPSKGRETELRAVEIFKSLGEIYHPPHAKFRNQDVFADSGFGGFDLLIYYNDHLEGIQIKTNQTSGITNWFNRVGRFRPAIEPGYAVLHEGQGWRVARYGDDPDDHYTDGYTWTFDGREGGPRTRERVDYELARHLMAQTSDVKKQS